MKINPFFPLFLLLLLCTHNSHAQDDRPVYYDNACYVKLSDRVQAKTVDDPWDIPPESLPFLAFVLNNNPLFEVAKVEQPFLIAKDEGLRKTYHIELQTNDMDILEAFIDSLEKVNTIDYAEKIPIDYLDEVPPNDPLYDISNLWHFFHIDSEDAWRLSQQSQRYKATVAVTDNAFQMDHEDLMDNYFTNENEVEDGLDTDGNGYVDDIRGWDAANRNNDPGLPDNLNNWEPQRRSHGTHVAGTVGAVTNNDVGIVGMGYESVEIIPVKIGNDFNGSLTGSYRGVIYSAAIGADIINMSWGSTGTNQTNRRIIREAAESGAILVGSSGNENVRAIRYPSGLDEVICVGATNTFDLRANFSNYGPWVDISAPGTDINSTYFDNTYNATSGTSMATPIVSGLLAIMKSLNPELSNEQLIECLYSTVEEIDDLHSPGFAGQLGVGRINAKAAMECVDAYPRKYDIGVAEVEIDARERFFHLTVENFGTNEVTEAQLKVVINDLDQTEESGEIETIDFEEDWNGTLGIGEQTRVSIPFAYLPPKQYRVQAYTSNPNGIADTRPGNDTLYDEFQVASQGKIQLYPNPSASGNLQAEFDFEEDTDIELVIYNHLGQVVHAQKLDGIQKTLKQWDFPGLKGQFLFSFYDTNENKLIKTLPVIFRP